MPVDYSKAKIYKIWSPSNPELVYIGSTCEPTLARRMSGHRTNYRGYLNGKGNYVTSFRVLECKDARIDLIKSVECKCKDELRCIEGKYIQEMNCVNRCVAGRTHKQWYVDNKERIEARDKKYYVNNKEKIKERNKKWKENNKEKVQCPCGSKVRRDGLSHHKKTNKHIKYIQSI